MKTEMILKEIAAKGEITERQISLLKRRSNKVQKDLYDYANVRVSADQGAKGLNWLRSLLRHDGTPRKGIYLGSREVEIIKSAEPNQFTFAGFYDDGYGWRANYLPVYEICGLGYIANSRRGKIYVIG